MSEDDASQGSEHAAPVTALEQRPASFSSAPEAMRGQVDFSFLLGKMASDIESIKANAVTKDEIQAVKSEIQAVKSEFRSEIKAVKSEIQVVKSELQSEIQTVAGTLKNFRFWTAALLISVIAIVVSILIQLPK
ncbi:MAG: hypothetical protein LBW85_01965 [Deltaproteobacteria bacterium]|jgi:DNA repair exonuclease SbcCD ATPase subunit|nr:hypothetical protein [Deltaproteobacteria bacterium]